MRHPMREGYWYSVIRKLENIWQRIDALDTGEMPTPMTSGLTTGLLFGR